jgi:hypothetical protein
VSYNKVADRRQFFIRHGLESLKKVTDVTTFFSNAIRQLASDALNERLRRETF